MIAAILEFLAQIDAQSAMTNAGMGGGLLWMFHTGQKRMEAITQKGFEDQAHAIKSLSKAIWLDLADRATPGSFVREEAKRMVEKDKREAD